MTILDEIRRCAFEYEMNTGIKPSRVYLGRGEMLALGKWAYEAGYKSEPTSRQKVLGLTAYEVDDDEPHMRCCA